MSNMAKNRLNSTWTPLGNEECNKKSLMTTENKLQAKTEANKGPDPLRGIFEERRALVGKWFDKWTDSQRKCVLEDLIGRCKAKQLQFTNEVVNRKMPVYHDDFTRCIPRVLSLYIFSFLDPRSLCRASQVCWYWKHLSETDQIWMPKCCRLGWVLTFSPSPYETGVWKRLYVEQIMALKCITSKVPKAEALKDGDKSQPFSSSDNSRNTPRMKLKDERPPWRGSDPVPKDTWRNNYLENDDEIEKVNKLRKRGVYGLETDVLTRNAKNKINTGLQSGPRPSAVPRSKSTSSFHAAPNDRPDWAKSTDTEVNGGAPFVSKTTAGDTDPRKAAPAVVLGKSNKYTRPIKLPSQRSARDLPSTDLFPSQPWQVPRDEEEYDSDVY